MLAWLGIGTESSDRELGVPMDFGNDSDVLDGMPRNSDLVVHVWAASKIWRKVDATFIYIRVPRVG
jgi:hypothetical protein